MRKAWPRAVHGFTKCQAVRNRTVQISNGNYSAGFPGGSDGKASACNAGDPSSILTKYSMSAQWESAVRHCRQWNPMMITI